MNNNVLEQCRTMWTLYCNELKKCINARITFIVFIIIFIGLILFALQLDSQPELVNYEDSQKYLQQDIEEISSILNDSGIVMSDSMRNMYINNIKIDEYMIENNIEPYKTHSIVNYLLSLNNLFALIVILSVVVVAQIVTNEYKYSTMNILITVPCKRYKILLSKILAMITICIGIVALMYIFSIIVGGLFFGMEGFGDYVVSYSNGNIQVQSAIEQSLINNFYNIFTLISCASFVLMISVWLKSGIIATCAGITVYLLGSQITIALKEYGWIKYTLFANMQFQMYSSGLDLFDGLTPSFSIIMLLIYSFAFLVISFIVFEKRSVYE